MKALKRSHGKPFAVGEILWDTVQTALLAAEWTGGPTTYEMHQHTGLLGLGFALFHGFILLGDHYTNFTVVQVLLPFATTGYRPLWVGFGQLALYIGALVGLSVYIRPQIGKKLWRTLHFLSFLAFGLGVAHALGSGTDSTSLWAQGFYLATGLIFLVLLVYRVGTAILSNRHKVNISAA